MNIDHKISSREGKVLRVENDRSYSGGPKGLYLNLGNTSIGYYFSPEAARQIRDAIDEVLVALNPVVEPVMSPHPVLLTNTVEVNVPQSVYDLLQKIENDDVDPDDPDGGRYGDRDVNINDFLPAGVHSPDGDWELG